MTKGQKTNINDTNYVDRDISWMYFNYRILKEAEREDVPLYERLNFLGIYSSNLDEFFKVRVAAIKQISESNVKERKEKKKIYKQIQKLNDGYAKEYDETVKNVFLKLKEKGINLIDGTELDDRQKEYVKNYFFTKINGYLKPFILTKKANLSSVNDSSVYLAVKMTSSSNRNDVEHAIIPLPIKECGRFVVLPDNEGKHYVMYIDDVVRMNLSSLFRCLNYDKFKAYAFKFSRDAEIEIESDPEEGLLKNILQAVKDRKKGLPVRIIFEKGIPEDLKNAIIDKFNVGEDEIISYSGKYHNNKDLMSFPSFGNVKSLKYDSWTPKNVIASLDSSIMEQVEKKDILINVPYQSYDTFIKFLQECAISKDVTAIKATIYRAARNSQVVSSLASASLNGKKVTCMVELMARFDESSNVSISQKLLDAGVEVLASKEGFKVHGKVMYIKKKNGNDMAVISTGNFHEGNARCYTDSILLTSDKRITREVKNLFEYLSQPYRHQTFSKLLVSPNHMIKVLQKNIRTEIENHEKGLPSLIQIKANHITDPILIQSLYEAARSGVRIEMLIRGNCSIRNDIEGISENIEIHGIIDKYLEHNRIFIFENGGKKKYFMGSSDLMPRNLYNRVEVVTPIYDEDCQKEIQYIFDVGFRDNTHATLVSGDGQYIPYRNRKGKVRSQEELYKHFNN
jgi:polyphosphate kinase